MKLLLILVVLGGIAYYFYFYQKAPDAPASPAAAETSEGTAAGPVPAVAPSAHASLDGVTALLRQDMDAIPVTLDGPGHPPANARAIKLKLRPYLNLHPEYQVLTRACDLIIGADAQRTTLQVSCHEEQARASFNNALTDTASGLTNDTSTHSAQTNGHVPRNLLLSTPPAKTGALAIHERVEGSWNTYRTQAAGQVQQLLAPLAGRRL